MPTTEHVTAGSLCLIEHGIRSFNLSAGRFAASLHLADAGSFSIPSKKLPGETFSYSAQLAGDQTLHNGPVDVDGQAYGMLWFQGTLQFTGKTIPVPPDGPTPVTKSAKFKMTGTLQAFANNPFIGDPGPTIVDVQLTGGGLATVRFSATSNDPVSGSGRWVRSIVYVFRA